MVLRLFQVVNATPTVEAAFNVLADGGYEELPAFGLVDIGPGGVRVVIQGAIVVEIDDGTKIDGSDYPVEATVALERSIRFSLDHSRPEDDFVFPGRLGIVGATCFRIGDGAFVGAGAPPAVVAAAPGPEPIAEPSPAVEPTPPPVVSADDETEVIDDVPFLDSAPDSLGPDPRMAGLDDLDEVAPAAMAAATMAPPMPPLEPPTALDEATPRHPVDQPQAMPRDDAAVPPIGYGLGEAWPESAESAPPVLIESIDDQPSDSPAEWSAPEVTLTPPDSLTPPARAMNTAYSPSASAAEPPQVPYLGPTPEPTIGEDDFGEAPSHALIPDYEPPVPARESLIPPSHEMSPAHAVERAPETYDQPEESSASPIPVWEPVPSDPPAMEAPEPPQPVDDLSTLPPPTPPAGRWAAPATTPPTAPPAAPEAPQDSAPTPAHPTGEQPLPTLGRLHLSSGGTIDLDRGVVFGRNPRPIPGWDGPTHHLIKINDPNRDVSGQHLEVRLENGHVTVRDLGSTNGSHIIQPGGIPVALKPHDPVVLQPGARVILAGAFDFVYDMA
jgi:hypothetical protein